MKPNILEVFIFLVFAASVALAWAEIYTVRDQLQSLRNENDLMILEIEHHAKLLTDMDLKLYPPGK